MLKQLSVKHSSTANVQNCLNNRFCYVYNLLMRHFFIELIFTKIQGLFYDVDSCGTIHVEGSECMQWLNMHESEVALLC